ncbi:MAG: ATP-grasp domain-containing protein [Oligoflexia bacterium]|nr:ATP-grasp domain-containing protein [Oligoflexia bacterium]
MNVLITCCGRKVYLINEVRKALHKLFPKEKHRVYVSDSSELSPSFHYADAGLIVPSISDPHYIKNILSFCTRYKISLLIPSKDTEIKKYAEHRAEFSGVVIPIPSLDLVKIFEDKYLFYKTLSNIVQTPSTFLLHKKKHHLAFPYIIKERGVNIETSGFFTCYDKHDEHYASKKLIEPIAQEKIDGLEYTVDALFDSESKPIVVIPRRRVRIRANVSDIGLVEKDPLLIKKSIEIAQFLRISGPCNLQWIRNNKGEDYLLEINPRISGGLQMTLAACPDFILALIKVAIGQKTKKLSYKNSVLTMKYDETVSLHLNINKKIEL